MKVAFDKSFHKRLLKIRDKAVLERIKQAIFSVEESVGPQQFPISKNWKDLKHFTGYGLATTGSG